jgi:hypothetical protein
MFCLEDLDAGPWRHRCLYRPLSDAGALPVRSLTLPSLNRKANRHD